MPGLDRRRFIQQSAIVALSGAVVHHVRAAEETFPKEAKFTMSLRCGSIGVRADQREAIHLAAKHGFTAVTPDAGYLSKLNKEQRQDIVSELHSKNLSWGAAGLTVPYTGDEESFQNGLKQFPQVARAMQEAGVTRVGTWIPPSHSELTYRQNFKRTVRRIRACAEILGEHGQRLGLEYIGPKTLWASKLHPFIHTMAEAKELFEEIGTGNVGFILDSWHWYTAHETVDDLLTLKNSDVVACDLNDAPRGILVDEQIDSRRELPAATGVIDIEAFLRALIQIGYDGPIRAEPFNQELNKLDSDAAVKATAAAMRKAFHSAGVDV